MRVEDLQVYQYLCALVFEVHELTMRFPKFEMYEEGNQIRRSSKSVRSNIVEGYGRRQYSIDYLRFLTVALSSNDETIDHLETLLETGSLQNETLYKDIHLKLETLGKKLNLFIQSVKRKSNQ